MKCEDCGRQMRSPAGAHSARCSTCSSSVGSACSDADARLADKASERVRQASAIASGSGKTGVLPSEAVVSPRSGDGLEDIQGRLTDLLGGLQDISKIVSQLTLDVYKLRRQNNTDAGRDGPIPPVA